MIGDEQLPEDSDRNPDGTLKKWPEWLEQGKPSPTGRFTFTTWRLYKKGDPLVKSGLLGPVLLRRGDGGDEVRSAAPRVQALRLWHLMGFGRITGYSSQTPKTRLGDRCGTRCDFDSGDGSVRNWRRRHALRRRHRREDPLGPARGGDRCHGAQRHAAAGTAPGQHSPHALCPEGPHHHSGGQGFSQRQRAVAAGIRAVSPASALASIIAGVRTFLQPRAGRSGHCPREHGRPLRRHRVRGRASPRPPS